MASTWKHVLHMATDSMLLLSSSSVSSSSSSSSARHIQSIAAVNNRAMSTTTTKRHTQPSRAFEKSNADTARRNIAAPSSPHRNFHSTSKTLAHFSFDTSNLVARLEKEGLNRQQALGVMEALEEVIEESIRTMTANLVTRAEQEKHQYTQKVDFAKLKSEITLLEKQDFSLLKSENERLLSEVEKLKQQLRENITRAQAGVRLDLNLEKGRIRDELSSRDLKLKEVDTRIESEINTLRGSMESVKFNVLQYLVGSLTGTGALLLAYLRLMS